MKILKKGQQKNLIVNKDMLSYKQFVELIEKENIVVFDENYNIYNLMKDTDLSFNFENHVCRIFCDDCSEIKVVYNKEWGFYDTVVVTKNGNQVSVKL